MKHLAWIAAAGMHRWRPAGSPCGAEKPDGSPPELPPLKVDKARRCCWTSRLPKRSRSPTRRSRWPTTALLRLPRQLPGRGDGHGARQGKRRLHEVPWHFARPSQRRGQRDRPGQDVCPGPDRQRLPPVPRRPRRPRAESDRHVAGPISPEHRSQAGRLHRLPRRASLEGPQCPLGQEHAASCWAQSRGRGEVGRRWKRSKTRSPL